MGQPEQKKQYTEEEMRSEIVAVVARLDKSFLRVVHSMMRTYSEEQLSENELTVICEPDGTPVEVEKFEEEMQSAIDAKGLDDGTSVINYKKKTEAWLGITQ